MITVCKVGDPAIYDWNLYCGRGNSPSYLENADLGNPYKIDMENNRTMAIEKFKKEFYEVKTDRAKRWREAADWMKRESENGVTIGLFCWCKPSKCHCDIFKNYAAI